MAFCRRLFFKSDMLMKFRATTCRYLMRNWQENVVSWCGLVSWWARAPWWSIEMTAAWIRPSCFVKDQEMSMVFHQSGLLMHQWSATPVTPAAAFFVAPALWREMRICHAAFCAAKQLLSRVLCHLHVLAEPSVRSLSAIQIIAVAFKVSHLDKTSQFFCCCGQR